MNRRGFIGGLASLLATATLDPERLLWRPGKKLISIPRPKVAFDKDAFSMVLTEFTLAGPAKAYFFGRHGLYEMRYGGGPSVKITDDYEEVNGIAFR